MAETRYLGDTATLSLALTHPDTGAAFTPTGHTLIFTLKRDALALDTAAIVQKISTVGGITVANPSVVTLVPADWASIKPGVEYVADIQAQNNSTGAILTVWSGSFLARPDVTKLATLSITTHTTNPSTLMNYVATPPAAMTSAGTAHQFAYDDEYFYLCVQTGTEGNALWLRAPLTEWS
jgi:hypothetical protein